MLRTNDKIHIRSGPVSRVLSWAIISLGCGLPAQLDATDPDVKRNGPLRDRMEPGDCSPSSLLDVPIPRLHPVFALLGLAPGGVCPASSVTRTAVRSYRTFSPLPQSSLRSCVAVCFLWHFPDPCGWWALPTTVSYGARTFLHAGYPAQRSPGPLRTWGVIIRGSSPQRVAEFLTV